MGSLDSHFRANLIIGCFLLSIAVGCFSAAAVTAERVNRSIANADRLHALVKELESQIKGSEEKLEKSRVKQTELRERLEALKPDEAFGKAKITHVNRILKLQEESDSRLGKKLEKLEKKLASTQEKAKSAEWTAKKYASQRQFEVSQRKVEKLRELLEYYKYRVKTLEILGREAEAIVITKSQLAGRAQSQWERWRSSWDQKLSRSRAIGILTELKTFRQKVKVTELELEAATAELQEADSDFSQFTETGKSE